MMQYLVIAFAASLVANGGGRTGGPEKSPDKDGANKPAVKFVAPGQVMNVPKTVPALSGDGAVVTHKFEDVQVEIGLKRDNPEAASQSISVRSTLEKHDKPVAIEQTLMGHVDLAPGVEAALVVVSCGKTTVVPLPKSRQGEVRAVIKGEVPPGQDYVATIFLALQRTSRDREQKGLIVVDTLELNLDVGTKPKR